MERELNDIDDLIGKVLAAEATAEEQSRLENWLLVSEENRHYYDQIKIIFDTASSRSIQLSYDEDAAWNKIRATLNSPRKDDSKFKFKHTGRVIAFRIAACVVFLLGVASLAYLFLDSPPETFVFATNEVKSLDTLPDGSTAFLNNKSSITYQYLKGKKTRSVKLKGEGFFEIKHEEEKPFIIETGELLIRDIGTAFNVKAYPESDTIVVTVQTGEVQIYTLKNEGLSLKQGETGIYSKRLQQFRRLEKIDTNILSYKTGVFSFNSTHLKSVIEKINEVYESDIRLESPSLDKCPITVNFHGDSLETIVDVIAETLNLTVSRRGKEIILKGNGCEP